MGITDNDKVTGVMRDTHSTTGMPSATEGYQTIDLVETLNLMVPLPVPKGLSMCKKNVIRRTNRQRKAKRNKIRETCIGVLVKNLMKDV